MSDSSPSASGPAPQRWLAVPASQLHWAEWSDEYALFHLPSGKTHFVNAATAQLLKTILASPRTVEEAVALLAPGAPMQELSELRDRVTGQLQLLEANGLVTVS
jgi:PqqD family protein of HPr-rel-A system